MKQFLLLIAAAFAACNGNNANLERVVATTPTPTPVRAAQQPPPTDGVRRITTGELAELMNQGKVVVVDVRNQAAYDLGHIRGAKLIPVPQVGERTKELPRDKVIVTYCA